MGNILSKLLLLAALILPVQVGIGVWSYRIPSSRRDALDRHRADAIQTIHFGDSVQSSVSPKDRDSRTLQDLLQAAMGEEKVGAVQGDGSSMELYLACAQYLARQDRRPRRLLIPVNLRSFSMEWDPRPEYQARLERLRLRYGDLLALGFRKPMSIWKIYPLDPVSREEYFRMPVVVDGKRIASVGDLVQGSRTAPGMSRLQSQFLFRYGYTLEPDHRKLRAMDDIVDTCRASGMEPIFYICPVDLETAERVAGPALRERIARNVDLVRTRMAGRQARLLDLSSSVKAVDFDWERTQLPNEHLTERGRRIVVRELEAALKAR